MIHLYAVVRSGDSECEVMPVWPTTVRATALYWEGLMSVGPWFVLAEFDMTAGIVVFKFLSPVGSEVELKANVQSVSASVEDGLAHLRIEEVGPND